MLQTSGKLCHKISDFTYHYKYILDHSYKQYIHAHFMSNNVFAPPVTHIILYGRVQSVIMAEFSGFRNEYFAMDNMRIACVENAGLEC